MNAQIAALYIALAYHLGGSKPLGVIVNCRSTTLDMPIYDEVLQCLELAAAQSNDAGLVSKIDTCRQLHARVKERK